MQTILSSPELTVILRSLGAEVCSVKNKQGTEFMWQADEKVWPRHAPVLFPIVGRLKDNAYVFNNESYTLSQHGFARDMAFSLISSSEKDCCFRLEANEQTKQKFPFDFIFDISYTLEKNRLTTSYKIKNTGTSQLLFSVGAHPGFNCPLLPGEKFEDYYLLFERNELSVASLANGLRTGEKTPLKLQDKKLGLTVTLFENDALVFEGSQITAVSLCSSVSDHRISMECENWPYFGIWNKDNAPFVCLEPWYGIADSIHSDKSITKKEGILLLQPRETFQCRYSVTFK